MLPLKLSFHCSKSTNKNAPEVIFQIIRLVSTSGLRHSGLQVFGSVVKLPKKNFWSDVTLVSLDDVSWTDQLPHVTLIRDLYILEMLISTWHLSFSDYAMCPWWHRLLTWSVDMDLLTWYAIFPFSNVVCWPTTLIQWSSFVLQIWRTLFISDLWALGISHFKHSWV